MCPEDLPARPGLVQRLEEWVLVLLVAVLVMLAFGQILLRNVFSYSLAWADPAIRHLVLWTSLLGALIATRRDKHIKIDVLTHFLPPRRAALVRAASGLFAGLICALLAWISLSFVADEREFGGPAFLDIPTWQLQLIFPISFGLMAVHFLHQAGRRALGLAGRSAA